MRTKRWILGLFGRMGGSRAGACRLFLLSALLSLMLLPVGEVHSSAMPTIQKLHVEGNDLKWIKGVGAPGSRYWLWIRQRSFKEDDRTPVNFNCANNTSDWLQFAPLEVIGASGSFTISGLDVMVTPPGVGTQNCNAALFTEFIVGFGASENDVPVLHMFNIPNYLTNDPEEWVETDIEGADRVAVAITDGPDDQLDAFGGMDMDEDGFDLCEITGLGCGHRVTFIGSGGTFISPAITENDSSVFGIPEPKVDNEYKYILSMAQAHASGASFLAAAKTKRDDDSLGPSIDVNVRINADLDIDCNGGFFNFLPL